MEPPAINRNGAHELAHTITLLYETAYSYGGENGVRERCVDEWMRNPVRNPRRLIRLLIHRLDVSRKLAGAVARAERAVLSG